MENAESTTRFAYDVSSVVARYLNACVLASSAVGQGDPGARTLCSFQFIINELDHGRYAGRQLPASPPGPPQRSDTATGTGGNAKPPFLPRSPDPK